MPPPTKFQLRNYQREAIKRWLEKDGVGFFEMCTGAGKTKTALSALALSYEYLQSSLFVLVIAPYQHLVSQWSEELSEFNITPIQIMGDSKKWLPIVSQKINDFNTGALNFCCLISTNASFSTEKFHDLISRIHGNFLFIADEAHNLGSQKALKYLPANANFKIGLSATPQRHHDEDGTNSLLDFFGERVVQFTLKDALENNFLTKYFYFVIPVYLDKEESQELERLSENIERLSRESGNKDFDSGKARILESLLFKRARLIASAKGKIPKLKEIVSKNINEIKSALFYCGDGTLVDEESNVESRQIELVTKLLGDDFGLNVHRFTSEESLDERKRITEMFVNDELDALIAIRCLDEGVDIPKIKVAFLLASTTNPKQFIQRRGRVLRKFKGKEFSTIYDFLVLPDPDTVSYKYSKSLILKELERINEFADLAINGPETIGKLREIKNKYNLMDK
jgi:superfamily II DNA or RNA helicase